MNPGAPKNRQRGAALWLLLFALIMAGGYSWYRLADAPYGRGQPDRKLAATLARAKAAVIAYAVVDDTRPGRLLCPDIVGDGISPLWKGSDCEAYSGWLPWKTLDLEEFTDDRGTRLYFSFHSMFGGNRATPALNSDLTTPLRVVAADGSIIDDVVGVIIAPRGNLDPPNAGNGPDFHAGKSTTDGDNDIVLPITRQELMAAVEKRVAGELRSCLEQHATSPANTGQRYPWPAPLSASAFQGKAGSYFGFVPLTQPGAGPEAMLQQLTQRLGVGRTALYQPGGNAQDQLDAARQLNDVLTSTGEYLRQLFGVSTALSKNALQAGTQLSALSANLNDAEIGTQASAAMTPLLALQQQLLDTGIDVFPFELSSRTLPVRNALGNLGPTPTVNGLTILQNQTRNLGTLLAQSSTPNIDIAQRLSAALSASTATQLAVQAAIDAPGNVALSDAAKSTANNLLTTVDGLQETIHVSRVNVDSSEITGHRAGLSQIFDQFAASRSASTTAALSGKLNEVKRFVAAIATSSSSVLGARDNGTQSLNAALAAVQAGSDQGLTASAMDAALGQLDRLAIAVRDNGDNVAQRSLNAATASFLTAQAIFAADAGQRGTLLNAAASTKFWLDIIANQAATVATLAGNPLVLNAPGSFAAYQKNTAALATLPGTLDALQKYIDQPTVASAQSAAATALASTLSALDALLASTGQLDARLASSNAAAFPMVWHSPRCGFLRDTSSWWAKNQWQPLVFYQIGEIQYDPAKPGKLTVNGSGSYRVVSLAAGSPLAALKQSRATPAVANYLEGINAGASRDGNANAPATAFAQQAPAADFNDRLSY